MSTTQPIQAGDVWTQVVLRPDAEGQVKPQVRVVEIIARPSLSSPVGLRIIRNDAHLHRVGKTTCMRAADLRRTYEAVVA